MARAHVGLAGELARIPEVLRVVGAHGVVAPERVQREGAVVVADELGAVHGGLLGHLHHQIQPAHVLGERAGVDQQHLAAARVGDVLRRVEHHVQVAAEDDVDAGHARDLHAHHGLGVALLAGPLEDLPRVVLALDEGLGALVLVVGLVAQHQLLVLGEAQVADDDDQIRHRAQQIHVGARRLVLLQRGDLQRVAALDDRVERGEVGHADDCHPQALHVADGVGRGDLRGAVAAGRCRWARPSSSWPTAAGRWRSRAPSARS